MDFTTCKYSLFILFCATSIYVTRAFFAASKNDENIHLFSSAGEYVYFSEKALGRFKRDHVAPDKAYKVTKVGASPGQSTTLINPQLLVILS
jgi:hypothetical protein